MTNEISVNNHFQSFKRNLEFERNNIKIIPND